MNLLKIINRLTATKEDTSPELKRGEIKNILLSVCNETLPDFKFFDYKNGCYFFKREIEFNGIVVYEVLHIIFSLKEKNFACSISSNIHKEKIYSTFYNIGLLNPHKDLKVLKHNSGALKIEDAYYFHNGKIETTTNIVKEIFNDYKKFGIPFLSKQQENLINSKIVKEGLNFINNLNADKEALKKSINEELTNGGLLLANIKNPIFKNLKQKLSSIEGLTKTEKGIIPKTANELLEIYWSRK